MKIQLECTYCGHIWVATAYNKQSVENMTCNHGNCRDSNLKVRDLASKIDYYQGCPPFPSKEEGWIASAMSPDFDSHYMGRF